MSGAEGFGGGPGNGFRDVNFEFGDSGFSDFFESMFGARRSPFGDSAFEDFAARGGDHEAVLELSLEEAAAGGRRKISLGDGRRLRGRGSTRRHVTASASGWPGRAERASVAARPGTCFCASD